ncbi:MAG TPA: methyltransferase domain-containing protein [Acidobacteriota bacterium]|nr:methyltransferase domain-containing protein [Acidobacteriota bacterium]
MKDLKEFLTLKSTDRVLDVGRGSGEWALGLASECAYVTGLGITEDDTAEASARAIQTGVANVSFQWIGESGIAGGLEFPDGAFDWVTCRWILSRSVQPETMLRELVRVLKTPGHLLLAERVGAADAAKRTADARLARSLDDSHQQTYVPKEIGRLLENAGFSVEGDAVWSESCQFERWVAAAGAPQGGVIERTRRLLQEAAKKKSTDWQITTRGKTIEFTHRFGVWVALKLG